MKKSSVLFLVLVAGCGNNPSSNDSNQVAMRGIRFGTTTKDYPSVVALVIEASGKKQIYCTSTAIDKKVVLTAGHCAEVIRSQPSARFYVRSGSNDLPIDAGIFHPDYRASGAVGSVDLALLRVKGSLSELSPIAGAESIPGDKLTAVGFGQDGNGADGNGTSGVKRTGTLTLEKIISATSPAGKSIPNALLYFNHSNLDTDQAACPGDSGGPVLKKGAVAGVVSGGQMLFGIRKCIYSLNSTYTSAYAFTSWIKTGVTRLLAP